MSERIFTICSTETLVAADKTTWRHKAAVTISIFTAANLAPLFAYCTYYRSSLDNENNKSCHSYLVNVSIR